MKADQNPHYDCTENWRPRPVCLLCYEALSVVKEYNLRWHFDTKYEAKYAKNSLQEKQQIVQELKGKLRL